MAGGGITYQIGSLDSYVQELRSRVQKLRDGVREGRFEGEKVTAKKREELLGKATAYEWVADELFHSDLYETEQRAGQEGEGSHG